MRPPVRFLDNAIVTQPIVLAMVLEGHATLENVRVRKSRARVRKIGPMTLYKAVEMLRGEKEL